MQKKWLVILGVFALASVGLVIAYTEFSSEFVGSGSQSSQLAYQPDTQRGKNLYFEACASCHGQNLEGQANWRVAGPDGRLPAPPHDATGHTWHHPDRVLLEITRRGTAAVVGGGYQSNMPGFGSEYTEEELRDVLAWIKTQWPTRERVRQARITAQDEASR